MQSRAGHDHLRGLTHSGVALKSADYWAHARPRHPFNLLVDEPDFESGVSFFRWHWRDLETALQVTGN